MKTQWTHRVTFFVVVVQLHATAASTPSPGPQGGASQKAIPWSQVGATAGALYSGDGLTVTPRGQGARLRCTLQSLEGEATREGLWIASPVAEQPDDRFRVKAVAMEGKGRTLLSATGEVSVEGQTVRFTRPGIMEEYTVSVDGLKQDFLVLENPIGASVPVSALAVSLPPPTKPELRVELAVTGAGVRLTDYGVQLVLAQSARKIAYSRLKVTDASGKELMARMEVVNKSRIKSQKSEIDLVVIVDDSNAAYPVRIDPTFSDANWVSLGGIPGANGPIYVAVVDGAGNLYVGGSFTLVGDVLANNVAKWNGSAWSALGLGVGNSDVNPPVVDALAVSGSNVYAGGSFTMAGGIAASNIAKWDGSAWSALGWGIGGGGVFFPPSVNALAVLGSDVYAAGYFLTAGGTTANYVAKWDGSTWSAVGSGMGGGLQYPPTGVNALAVLGGNVYAGGNFTSAGGVSANYIAKWDGSAWSALSSGMDYPVNAIAVSGGDLYAGGDFMNAGGTLAISIAKWDGGTWSALGTGWDYGVSALAVSGSEVYVGWTTNPICAAGGCEGGGAGVAKWDGSTWSALGSGMGIGLGPSVNALAISGGSLFAGGGFTTANASTANNIAQWNGSAWSALSSGIGGGDRFDVTRVNVVAASGSNVYVGGTFITAGTEAINIARWDGKNWNALGSGITAQYGTASVSALGVSGGDLYVGGNFTTAGGIAAICIAKWDGRAWSALGSGMNYQVNAMAVSGSDVYAAGWFTTAGGVAVNYIAKWDGSSWSALGSGMNSAVFALAVSGSNVYAGGQFTTAGGIAANSIAKWDGSVWSTLGSGMNNGVYGLAISGTNLYAAGVFTMAGGVTANNIAQWNGSAWTVLGSGMNNQVNALAVSGSDLYAGGYFTAAGGSPASNIAKWDGSTWSAMGSGANGAVIALAISGGDLYAAGPFLTAGGKVSPYVAKAFIGPPPFYFVSTNSSMGSSKGQFYFTLAGPAGSNAVIFASTNLQTWTPLATNPLTGGSLNFTDALATNFIRRFYRALLQP